MDDSSQYSQLWGLAAPFICEALWLSPVGLNGGVACSEDGTVYLRTIGSEAGVSMIDVNTGTVTKLVSIPPTIETSDILGGPGDTAFMLVGAEVWQFYPDGTYTVWQTFLDIFIVAYMPSGRMFGKSMNGSSLYELYQDGSKRLIASDFNNIYNACVTEDGVLFVYEWDTGNVVRVEQDGTKRVLVESVMPWDFANLGLDFDGQLYLNSAGTYGLKRVEMETGELTNIPNVYNEIIVNPNDFVFIEPGKIVITGDHFSWADINAGTNGLIVQNISSTYATDIGPDGALYIGVSDTGNSSGQIRRISDDGTQSVLFGNIRGCIEFIAFTPDGYLYAVTKYDGRYHLLFINPEKGVQKEIPGMPQDMVMALTINPKNQHAFISLFREKPIYEFDIYGLVTMYNVKVPWDAHEYRIDFASDGSLYSYIGRMDNSTTGPWLAKIDLNKLASTEVAMLSCTAPGGMGAFRVSPDGNLWLYLNPESVLYKVTPEGEVTVFATSLPVDAPSVVVGEDDNVYFACSAGLFHIYKEQ
ncbi:MAG: hypothetical protein JW811_07460 [Clostridiales bacterium]|nr:hypothetical protein [Clostridiales bacterium]